MSFTLTSHMTLGASSRQYFVDHTAPVRFTLYGPDSYCCLKNIQSSQLKAILSKVGDVFEKEQSRTFLNVSHTFTPVEATESKSTGSCGQTDQNPASVVQDIFSFVKTAVSEQTDTQLTLDLTDINRLIVKKAVDHSYLTETHKAYELDVGIPEKTVKAAERLGLTFRKYDLPKPSDRPAYILDVGR